MSAEIRVLTAAEIPLLPRLFSYNDVEEMFRTAKIRMDAGKMEIYALFLDGVLQGELRVSFDNSDPNEDTADGVTIPGVRAYLYAFRVHDDVQGQGWGQRLLRHTLDALRKKGYCEFTIGVEDDNHLARHIYEKHGFTEVIARCEESYQGDSYEYDLLLKRDDQNIYDNPTFFDGYRALRKNPASANELIEKPALFALCPDLTGKRVLDMGCGCGENCREFARRGAAEVMGIDISGKLLAVAEAENDCEAVRFLRHSMSDLAALPGKFDVIFSSLAVHYVQDFPALMRAAADHLPEGGRLIFSQEHPLTTAVTDGSYWYRDESGRVLHYKLTDYGNSGRRSTRWFVDNVIKYHRTFSEIVCALADAGFCIEEMREPIPSPEIIERYPSYAKDVHKPDFLLIRARKNR